MTAIGANTALIAALLAAQGPMHCAEIARRLDLHERCTYTCIRTLERYGLISKKPTVVHNRKAYIYARTDKPLPTVAQAALRDQPSYESIVAAALASRTVLELIWAQGMV